MDVPCTSPVEDHVSKERRSDAFPVTVPRSVWERAGELHHQVMTSEVWMAGGAEVVGGCLLVACREVGVPVMTPEIGEFVGVDAGLVVDVSMVIRRVFDVSVSPGGVSGFVDRFVDELRVGECVSSVASDLAVVCDERGVATGRAPRIVAAACVYVAGKVCASGGGVVTQSEVAGAGETTARSVRGAVTAIRDRVGVQENPEFNRGSSGSVGVQVSVDE